MLKVKTFTEIVNNMASWILTHSTKLTNFRVGSVIRTLIESVAIELESMYFEMYKGFKYALENSIFNSFGFTRKTATHAIGQVLVLFRTPLMQELIIPQGYKFSTAPSLGRVMYYEALEDIVCQIGVEQVTIDVRCVESGVVGNVSAGMVNIMSTYIPFVDRVYNAEPISGGVPEESEEARKERFTQHVNTLSNGTLDAIKYGCGNVSGVTGVYIEEGVGIIFVYIHDAQGNLPDALKIAVENAVVSFKPAGIEVFVLPIIKRPIDMFISVQLDSALSISQMELYRESIKSSIISRMNSFAVSQNLLRADIITFIMSINTNIIVNTTIDLTEDIITEGMELIRAGEVTVTVYK